MSARLTAAGAFVLALAVHAGLVLALVRPQEAKLEGAGQPQETALGANFTSLATPATPVGTAPPTLEATRPEPLKALTATVTSPATSAAQPAPLKPLNAKPAATPAPASAVAAEPVPEPEPEIKAKPKPRVAAKPVKKAEPKPSPKPAAKPAPKPAKKGTASGRSTAKPKPSSSAAKKPRKKAGNAAVTNYPGRINRHIAKRGRPSVGVKGRAVIRFTIAANGRLTSASVVRSSGSAKLDRAALQLIRRAAPFPRPPAGAQRSFSIGINGR